MMVRWLALGVLLACGGQEGEEFNDSADATSGDASDTDTDADADSDTDTDTDADTDTDTGPTQDTGP